jgi:hypothetical protein
MRTHAMSTRMRQDRVMRRDDACDCEEDDAGDGEEDDTGAAMPCSRSIVLSRGFQIQHDGDGE